jgi:hypothetical protein
VFFETKYFCSCRNFNVSAYIALPVTSSFMNFYVRIVALVLCFSTAKAQQQQCGFDLLSHIVGQSGPRSNSSLYQFAQKTMFSAITIPVAIHFVLDSAQLQELGGETRLLAIAERQIATVNRCFNGMDSFIDLCPTPFLPYVAATNINFALAHTNPQGDSTPGFDLLVTSKNAFPFDAQNGSKLAYADCKYRSADGLDAWDPARYLNVWVIGVGPRANIIAVTVPPRYAANGSMPEAELGIVTSYKCFGVRDEHTRDFDAFRAYGKTLTHELGHYFGLWHTWGDDNGRCPDNGGDDDSLTDTPPQSGPSFGFPAFPKLDYCCTNCENGVMFNNYMDYAGDSCRNSFTPQQVTVMRSKLAYTQESFSLTMHDYLTKYPTRASFELPLYRIYPNPAMGAVYIEASALAKAIDRVAVYDITGRLLTQYDGDGTEKNV